MELEKIVVPREIYHRDIAWIEACDAIVAEVSTPSHGVGYEIAYALSIGKPVFCCYQEGVSVSKMLTGNDSSSFVIQAYTDTTQALELLDSFLSEV
jgi:nucleoside 2-deoxyribosyltransferase